MRRNYLSPTPWGRCPLQGAERASGGCRGAPAPTFRAGPSQGRAVQRCATPVGASLVGAQSPLHKRLPRVIMSPTIRQPTPNNPGRTNERSHTSPKSAPMQRPASEVKWRQMTPNGALWRTIFVRRASANPAVTSDPECSERVIRAQSGAHRGSFARRRSSRGAHPAPSGASCLPHSARRRPAR